MCVSCYDTHIVYENSSQIHLISNLHPLLYVYGWREKSIQIVRLLSMFPFLFGVQLVIIYFIVFLKSQCLQYIEIKVMMLGITN